MKKSRWPLYRGFGSHVKNDNANRLADPQITRFQRSSEKKIESKKKISRQVAAIFIIGGMLKI